MIGEPELPLQPLAGDGTRRPRSWTGARPWPSSCATAPRSCGPDSRSSAPRPSSTARIARASRTIFLRVEADYDRELSEAQPGRRWVGRAGSRPGSPYLLRSQPGGPGGRARQSRARQSGRAAARARPDEPGLRRVRGVPDFPAHVRGVRAEDPAARRGSPPALSRALPADGRGVPPGPDRAAHALPDERAVPLRASGSARRRRPDPRTAARRRPRRSARPGKMEPGIGASEIPGAVRSGELPVSVKPPGQE